MAITTIKSVLDNEALTNTTVTVAGWVRTFRNDRFIALNDGSTILNLQCVIDQNNVDAATRSRFTTSASVRCTGVIVPSQGSGQRVEMQVTEVEVLGDSDPEKYPIQPKKHSLEFLREKAHLRFRTNTYSAIFRMRHQVSFGIHEYFDSLGYNYFHSPIITASDAEGAGEMFRVTTLPIEDPPVIENETPVNYALFDTERATLTGLAMFKMQEILSKEEASGELIASMVNALSQTLSVSFDKFEDYVEYANSTTTEALHKTDGWVRLFKKVQAEMTGAFQFVEKRVREICEEHGYTLKSTPMWDRRVSIERTPLAAFSFYNLFQIVNGRVDYSQDFFGAESRLTVSGQLQGELAATALGKAYTFGPTFRAENSNTARHLAEFWMIEPETAFMDLHGNMDLAEGMCKHLIARVLRNSMDDLQFLDARLREEEATKPKEQRSELGLIDRLKFVLENPFERITYTNAVDILLRSKPHQKGQFQYKVEWGNDLQSEHERYLVEKHFKKPVIVTGYPAGVKAFYMRMNGPGDFGYKDENYPTVAAMDVLFPGIGEIIGGSQREERLDKLEARMEAMGVDRNELDWFLDTRRFGTVPHSGFGLGLERFVLFVTGMGNIRDVIPFPRTPKSAEF